MRVKFNPSLLQKKNQRRVSRSERSERLIYMAVIISAIALVAVGFFLGSKTASGAGVGVIALAASARNKIKKINSEAKSLNSKIEEIVSHSVSHEEQIHEDADSNDEALRKAARDSLDTSDSAWERRTIFPSSNDG